jgi:hypothetical protein
LTLVVAQAFRDAIHFVSDTRRWLEKKVREKDPLVDGVLKCVLISRDICVAFAGDVKAAEKAIAPLLQRGGPYGIGLLTPHLEGAAGHARMRHGRSAPIDAAHVSPHHHLGCYCVSGLREAL